MCTGGRVDGQRDIDEQFTEEKPTAAIFVDQAGVFADPAQPGIARQGALQYGRRIGEGAVAEWADFRLHDLR